MSTAWLILTAGVTFAIVALVGAVAPRRVRSTSSTGVLVVVAASAMVAVLAPGAPTRIAVVDAAFRGLFGATCAVAAAWVTARTRLVAAVIVAIPPFLGNGGGGFAMIALGLAVGGVLLSLDAAVLGAVVGLAIGQAALRLGWPSPTGLTAAVAAGALFALALPALASLPRESRRVVLIPLVALGAIAGFVVTGYALVVLSARGQVNEGVDFANAALAAAREGRTREAGRLFDEARTRFEHAHNTLDAWWTEPVLAVPIASPHARALSQMSEIGVDLAASGARTARAADPDATKLVDGAVPVEAIRMLEAPFVDARTSLRHASRDLDDIDATWLVGPVDDRLATLRQDLAHATRDARTGVIAARVVPTLLGGAGASKRYFVAFQNPAEQRAAGGIIGNFAVIDFTNGRLREIRSGRDGDLNTEGSAVRTLIGPPDYLARYSRFRPQNTWQNVTMSPDWPSVAQVIESLYPQSGGERVDGAISIDPIALAALLELTGPVDVSGLDEPLTSENAARILLREQYTRFPDLQERVDFLQDAFDAMIERLQTGALPNAARVGEVLGPMVRQGRLKVHSVDPEADAFFRRIGATGHLPTVRGDFAGLVTQNASGNKIELFLHRAVKYDVTVDPVTQTAHATVTITLRNNAPTSGFPDSVIAGSGAGPTPRGYYRGYVSFYTPLALQHATIDGRDVTLETARELDRNVLSTFVDAPSRTSTTIQLDLSGPVHMEQRGDQRCYTLTVWHQPTIRPDRLVVRVAGAEETRLESSRGAREVDNHLRLETRPVDNQHIEACLS